MSRLARTYRTNVELREKAAGLVQFVPGQAYRQEAEELFRFVRDDIRYLRDVDGVETLQAPDYTLRKMFGDCDDKSVLLATLLMSIGHPARFVAVGFGRPNDFDHVYVETAIGNPRDPQNWYALETTVPDAEFGWSPATERRPSAYMRENI